MTKGKDHATLRIHLARTERRKIQILNKKKIDEQNRKILGDITLDDNIKELDKLRDMQMEKTITAQPQQLMNGLVNVVGT